jgi:hypothetical protein
MKLRLTVKNTKECELDLNYKSNLYKMQTDQLSFEKFEELFDAEDEDLANEPAFESGWRRSEVGK